MRSNTEYQLSIVIVNYDTWLDVLALVRQLTQMRAFQNGLIEILVVDNNSPSVKPERPEIAGIRWIDCESNGGFGAGANAGCHEASGKWLLMLNPDVTVAEQTVDQVLALLDEIMTNSTPLTGLKIGIAGIGLTNPDGTHQPSVGTFPTLVRGFIELFLPRSRRRYQIVSPQKFAQVDWVTGAFFLVDSKLMHEISGFDEDFFLYYEETDLCRRALNHGWHTVFEPRITALHQKPLQNRQVSPMIRLITRHSRLLYFHKHRSGFEFRSMAWIVRTEAQLRRLIARTTAEKTLWKSVCQLCTAFRQGSEPRGQAVREWAEQVLWKST